MTITFVTYSLSFCHASYIKKTVLKNTRSSSIFTEVMNEMNPPNDTITFLGTGAGRFMITSQRLASGGIWMNLGGTQLLVDPGPGCIVRATDRKLDAQNLSAIILSHRHLDHSADTNIMVEAMTRHGNVTF